ncbi:uncharacterized protein [Pseudochaenichthys georgianus]|uniref:uncharacterized protein n=1 Tax=Pseudochaenichthys georgianus TaxID=52239 RepID=UPI001469F608|nr:vegetative cell wall protein gp1-like [Pseudochaenichthys georgianus]
MPSEASPQEPRDRGPLPPVTRAGRSAQLAKEAATSPAFERRSRGRPRKDGPPTPPPPTPTPPKARKGRSRGRAQVDDEESMDATEKPPPQKTEVKEKTTGRRRSTSRRKSNTNPEPDPSPEPEPDPEPAPPAPSPAPASSPEKEPPVRPPSPDLIPVQSPDLSPVLIPVQSPVQSPDLIPVQSPDLIPVQSPDLIPVQSPDLIPVQSPGPDPGEEEEEVQPILSPAPVDQSPAPSSPPASPCPPPEDEDSLSPLFQLSDEGGSPTPSLGHTKKRLKQCAFCSLGSAPPLGLGPLVVFGPTPGYIPLHILNSRSPPDRDNDCHDHCYHGDQAPPLVFLRVPGSVGTRRPSSRHQRPITVRPHGCVRSAVGSERRCVAGKRVVGGASTSRVLQPPELCRTGTRDTRCAADTHTQPSLNASNPSTAGRSNGSDGDIMLWTLAHSRRPRPRSSSLRLPKHARRGDHGKQSLPR